MVVVELVISNVVEVAGAVEEMRGYQKSIWHIESLSFQTS